MTVRNKFGNFINTELFRGPALHYEKYGYYTEYPEGSYNWIEFWKEEMNKCINGYCVGGACITGHHYFYLNYFRILAIDFESKVKVSRFPDFWDGDYNFFWALEIARKGISKSKYEKLKLMIEINEEDLKGGKNIIVLKARRKGFSYKTASILVNTYNFYKNSLSIIGAYVDEYSRDTFDKAKKGIDFINSNTGWRKGILAERSGEDIISGYKVKENGVWVNKGYLSEIKTVSFIKNVDIARGKDLFFVAFEEMGSFPNAKKVYASVEPATKAGAYKTGTIIMYGTSSNMESAIEFEEMFYNPTDYNSIRFKDIWSEEKRDIWISFFFPAYWNKEGFYDKDGNSKIKKAIDSELQERANKKTSTALNDYIIEYPLTPEEAFRRKESNIFPVAELQKQLSEIKVNRKYEEAIICDLIEESNSISIKPDFSKSKEPIWFYSKKPENLEGAVVIYEPPMDNTKFGFYKIGYDPVAQDEGSSLAAIYVFKPQYKNNPPKIVASYIGRPKEANEANRIAYMLAKLYNTDIMFENMFIHVVNYFRRRKILLYLAEQPNTVISKTIKNSRVNRVYGIHMTEQLKDAGEKFIKDWLLEINNYTEDGEPVYNYQTIEDPGLLEELIKYTRKGNFDRVMAFMMVMFQLEETKEITNKEEIDFTQIYEKLLTSKIYVKWNY